MNQLDSHPAGQICPVCGGAKASKRLACGACAPGLNTATEEGLGIAPPPASPAHELSWVPALLSASGLFLLTFGLLTSQFWTWQNSYADSQPQTGARNPAPAAQAVVLAEWVKPSEAIPTDATPGHIASTSLTPSQAARRGLVWINRSGRMAVRPGHSWYGNTTDGYYTSENQARREGATMNTRITRRG